MFGFNKLQQYKEDQHIHTYTANIYIFIDLYYHRQYKIELQDGRAARHADNVQAVKVYIDI